MGRSFIGYAQPEDGRDGARPSMEKTVDGHGTSWPQAMEGHALSWPKKQRPHKKDATERVPPWKKPVEGHGPSWPHLWKSCRLGKTPAPEGDEGKNPGV